MRPLILLAMLGATAHAQLTRQACLAYEPDTVIVRGVLHRHTYFGAPGFGEDPSRDARETGFYLDLPVAACVSPHGSDYPAAVGVRRIQLVLDSAGYARLRPSLGKSISVGGTLFHAMSGHHHTAVLLKATCPVETTNHCGSLRQLGRESPAVEDPDPARAAR
jgi:hypothetical protein